MSIDHHGQNEGETGQMHEPAATLESGGDRTDDTVAKHAPYRPGNGPMKFVYSTGARPLDGYTIKRGVGIGGFGEVYFATSDAGKEVALKRIQRNLDVEIRGVTHCLNMNHPNLISIYDIKYDDQGEGWIVMEFINGESLKDVIDRNPNGMPMELVRSWFSGIAAGVAYLHDHGIVHRDLKPGNIFSDDNIVKIGDYGLSKFISCSRRSGQTESVGTFHYMAPEIGKGVYGKEIDIYALGIILFEMMTGRVPFDGESSQEIIMKHLTAAPDLGGVSPRFQKVIGRCLFKDPAKRFSSVSEMLHALQFDTARSSEPIAELTGNPTAHSPVGDIPPVVVAAVDPVYIGEDGTVSDEIVFGPVVEVVGSGQASARTAHSASGATQTAGEDREPIAAAVVDGYHRVTHWWRTANISTPIKVVLLVAAIIILIVNSEILVPLAFSLGILYAVYFAIRSLVVGKARSQPEAPSTTETKRTELVSRQEPTRRRSRRLRRTSWRQSARESLARKPLTERMAELTGSLLFSAIVCGVLCLVIMLAGDRSLDGSVDNWTFFTWMTCSSVIGSWMILGIGKFWEGRDGDDVLRRFAMLVSGLVFGLAVYFLANVLMVRLSTAEMYNVLELPPDIIPSGMLSADGAPSLAAFLTYFATLFLILRWWKQADPVRSTRFSLWATMVAVFWAMIIPWQVPWGFMLAVTISVATQISAPWMTTQQRSRIARDAVEV